MMEIPRRLTPSLTVCRRRRGRAHHIARLLLDEEEGWPDGIGDIDDDFDMVDIDDVVREARGGRRPVVETESF